MDCWRAVNEHTKWTTYNEWLEQSKKRKMPETGEMGKHTSTPDDAEDIPCPPGIEKSKKECNGKGKSKEVAADMELLDKLVATHEEAKKTRRDMIEMQQRSSSEKLEVARLSAETARLSALAAKDNIEAKKQEKEAEIMRAYRVLLVQDTKGTCFALPWEIYKKKPCLWRDAVVDLGEQAMDDVSTFYLLRHDEGPNMRRPVIERDDWVMLLGFPLNYQTEHYIIKVVSWFDCCMFWHRRGFKKSRVLVRILVNELALVPYSLLIKRFAVISGMGQSWTIPVYVLNGKDASHVVLGNEDDVPPMGASPHPDQPHFLTAMQQAQHDAQVWEMETKCLGCNT
ncbi:hypothetical protein D1007_39493 [Hordeum vulgare]|nr:hypothetical protein D1007_39493 [Hordeum vulgare]